MPDKLPTLLSTIRSCRYCVDKLPHEPRPVIQAAAQSKILIAGQAPGRRVYESGVPWEDPSGDRLRSWMAMDKQQFYDPDICALVPMGFCYPGKGKSGDLPPRKECAELYFADLFKMMSEIKLTLVIGIYAQNHHLGALKKDTLTATLKNWQAYLPKHIVLPHPSPRNVAWFKNNPWFEKEVLPYLKDKIKSVL